MTTGKSVPGDWWSAGITGLSRPLVSADPHLNSLAPMLTKIFFLWCLWSLPLISLTEKSKKKSFVGGHLPSCVMKTPQKNYIFACIGGFLFHGDHKKSAYCHFYGRDPFFATHRATGPRMRTSGDVTCVARVTILGVSGHKRPPGFDHRTTVPGHWAENISRQQQKVVPEAPCNVYLFNWQKASLSFGSTLFSSVCVHGMPWVSSGRPWHLHRWLTGSRAQQRGVGSGLWHRHFSFWICLGHKIEMSLVCQSRPKQLAQISVGAASIRPFSILKPDDTRRLPFPAGWSGFEPRAVKGRDETNLSRAQHGWSDSRSFHTRHKIAPNELGICEHCLSNSSGRTTTRVNWFLNESEDELTFID